MTAAGPEPVSDERLRPSAWGLRAFNGLAAAGAAGVLAVALALSPDPAGVGTHQELGLLPCGFLFLTGVPCPFCGMTTAFAFMAQGQVLQAVVAQPMGAVLFVATAVAAGVFGLRALQTAPPSPLSVLEQAPRAAALAVGGGILAAWLFKIWTTVGA